MNNLLKYSLLSTILVMTLAFTVSGQTPITVWTERYGGEGSYSDKAYAGCATSDDCYILVGYSNIYNLWKDDGYLVKFDIGGDTAVSYTHLTLPTN